MATNPTITLGAYNVEADDPERLARFWADLTGGSMHVAGDSVYVEPAAPSGFGVFVQPISGPRPDRQLGHLDLTVPWGQRPAAVDRAVEAGARVQWDVLEEFAHVQWTTLADPEGNLFCIAEHPPTA